MPRQGRLAAARSAPPRSAAEGCWRERYKTTPTRPDGSRPVRPALAERLALANSRERNKINKKRRRKSPAASSCELCAGFNQKPWRDMQRSQRHVCQPNRRAQRRAVALVDAATAITMAVSHHGIRHGRGQRQCRWQQRCRGRGRKRPSWTGPGQVKPLQRRWSGQQQQR